MGLNEFDLIDKYFNQKTNSPDILIGVGDDCALLQPPVGKSLAVTTDTLVSGVHFFSDFDPKKLGHKCLAVNLSDLAAMGAKPAWVTLSITMPSADELWVEQFCQGFFGLAKRYDVNLVGGDLTHGPLSVTVQATGFVSESEALRRNAAEVGDAIFVSGCLGDAGAALALLKEKKVVPSELLNRLECPEAQVELGLALRQVANAAIDISDGFLADLQHILDASHLGAVVYIDKLPLSNTLKQTMSDEVARELALTSGDDYELCFTVSKKNHEQYSVLLTEHGCVCVGSIEKEQRLKLMRADGSIYHASKSGYLHFSFDS